MLKLKQNVVPTGVINGTNKVFKVDQIIGTIQSIYVDGNLAEGYQFDGISITLSTAPASSILVNYFYREVNGIKGEGLVTLGDLKMGFYRKIGRVNPDGSVPQNINKLYPEDYVKDELRKSFKRIVNKSPEKTRVQQYALKGINGYRVKGDTSNDAITLEESITQEIAGVFFLGKGVAYDYYSITDGVFQVRGADISEIGDKVIVGNRIPYGVQKITSIYVDGAELEYIDERSFNMNTLSNYTIVKDWQGNKYLILPYSDKTQVTVVKYITELDAISDENDIIDIQEEYADVIIYDTAYKLLQDKEDERWVSIKNELGNGKKEGLLFDYQSYVKSEIKVSRHKIGISRTYKHSQY